MPSTVQYLHQLALWFHHSFHFDIPDTHEYTIHVWCSDVCHSECLPGMKTRNRFGIWKMRPNIFFLWCPSVQVKGGQLYSQVKKWNNIWLIQMQSEMLSVFGFSSPLCVFWVNSHFTPIPWLLLLCHTVPSLGATPKPGTCSHYCRLFTWHTLKPACILTPAPTACFGASFGLFYPFLAALFQLLLKK